MYVANIADKDAAKKDTPLLNQIRQMAKEEKRRARNSLWSF